MNMLSGRKYLQILYYGLNLKCPPKSHLLKVWLIADGALGKCLDHEGSDFNGLLH
jgi:hypothetical protein